MILKENIGDDGCCFYKAVSLYFDVVGVVDSEQYGPDALRSKNANTLKNYGCFLVVVAYHGRSIFLQSISRVYQLLRRASAVETHV